MMKEKDWWMQESHKAPGNDASTKDQTLKQQTTRVGNPGNTNQDAKHGENTDKALEHLKGDRD
eukprot:4635763-Prorocentrum_lima.AAC.1